MSRHNFFGQMQYLWIFRRVIVINFKLWYIICCLSCHIILGNNFYNNVDILTIKMKIFHEFKQICQVSWIWHKNQCSSCFLILLLFYFFALPHYFYTKIYLKIGDAYDARRFDTWKTAVTKYSVILFSNVCLLTYRNCITKLFFSSMIDWWHLM